MLKIWGRSNSINVQKVLWTCDELDLAYDRTDAGGDFGVNDTPAYRALNPNARVPVLEDDGLVLWESNVIVRYLSAGHGADILCPNDLKERANVERWMDWQATTLWPPLRPLFLALVRAPNEAHDPEAMRSAEIGAAAAFEILDNHLADKDFVGGSHFTMGDIPVGATAHRWFALPIKRPSLPHLQSWYDRLAARPPFRKHVMHPLT